MEGAAAALGALSKQQQEQQSPALEQQQLHLQYIHYQQSQRFSIANTTLATQLSSQEKLTTMRSKSAQAQAILPSINIANIGASAIQSIDNSASDISNVNSNCAIVNHLNHFNHQYNDKPPLISAAYNQQQQQQHSIIIPKTSTSNHHHHHQHWTSQDRQQNLIQNLNQNQTLNQNFDQNQNLNQGQQQKHHFYISTSKSTTTITPTNTATLSSSSTSVTTATSSSSSSSPPHSGKSPGSNYHQNQNQNQNHQKQQQQLANNFDSISTSTSTSNETRKAIVKITNLNQRRVLASSGSSSNSTTQSPKLPVGSPTPVLSPTAAGAAAAAAQAARRQLISSPEVSGVVSSSGSCGATTTTNHSSRYRPPSTANSTTTLASGMNRSQNYQAASGTNQMMTGGQSSPGFQLAAPRSSFTFDSVPGCNIGINNINNSSLSDSGSGNGSGSVSVSNNNNNYSQLSSAHDNELAKPMSASNTKTATMTTTISSMDKIKQGYSVIYHDQQNQPQNLNQQRNHHQANNKQSYQSPSSSSTCSNNIINQHNHSTVTQGFHQTATPPQPNQSLSGCSGSTATNQVVQVATQGINQFGSTGAQLPASSSPPSASTGVLTVSPLMAANNNTPGNTTVTSTTTTTSSASGYAPSLTSGSFQIQESSMLQANLDHQFHHEHSSGPSNRGRRLSNCGLGLRANFLSSKHQAISDYNTSPTSLLTSFDGNSSTTIDNSSTTTYDQQTTNPIYSQQSIFQAANNDNNSSGIAKQFNNEDSQQQQPKKPHQDQNQPKHQQNQQTPAIHWQTRLQQQLQFKQQQQQQQHQLQQQNQRFELNQLASSNFLPQYQRRPSKTLSDIRTSFGSNNAQQSTSTSTSSTLTNANICLAPLRAASANEAECPSTTPTLFTSPTNDGGQRGSVGGATQFGSSLDQHLQHNNQASSSSMDGGQQINFGSTRSGGGGGGPQGGAGSTASMGNQYHGLPTPSSIHHQTTWLQPTPNSIMVVQSYYAPQQQQSEQRYQNSHNFQQPDQQQQWRLPKQSTAGAIRRPASAAQSFEYATQDQQQQQQHQQPQQINTRRLYPSFGVRQLARSIDVYHCQDEQQPATQQKQQPSSAAPISNNLNKSSTSIASNKPPNPINLGAIDTNLVTGSGSGPGASAADRHNLRSSNIHLNKNLPGFKVGPRTASGSDLLESGPPKEQVLQKQRSVLLELPASGSPSARSGLDDRNFIRAASTTGCDQPNSERLRQLSNVSQSSMPIGTTLTGGIASSSIFSSNAGLQAGNNSEETTPIRKFGLWAQRMALTSGGANSRRAGAGGGVGGDGVGINDRKVRSACQLAGRLSSDQTSDSSDYNDEITTTTTSTTGQDSTNLRNNTGSNNNNNNRRRWKGDCGRFDDDDYLQCEASDENDDDISSPRGAGISHRGSTGVSGSNSGAGSGGHFNNNNNTRNRTRASDNNSSHLNHLNVGGLNASARRRQRRESRVSSCKGVAEINSAGTFTRDQLTLADRLKMAERSANELFRKVDLSAAAKILLSSQESTSGQQQQQQQMQATEISNDLKKGGSGGSNLNRGQQIDNGSKSKQRQMTDAVLSKWNWLSHSPAKSANQQQTTNDSANRKSLQDSSNSSDDYDDDDDEDDDDDIENDDYDNNHRRLSKGTTNNKTSRCAPGLSGRDKQIATGSSEIADDKRANNPNRFSRTKRNRLLPNNSKATTSESNDCDDIIHNRQQNVTKKKNNKNNGDSNSRHQQQQHPNTFEVTKNNVKCNIKEQPVASSKEAPGAPDFNNQQQQQQQDDHHHSLDDLSLFLCSIERQQEIERLDRVELVAAATAAAANSNSDHQTRSLEQQQANNQQPTKPPTGTSKTGPQTAPIILPGTPTTTTKNTIGAGSPSLKLKDANNNNRVKVGNNFRTNLTKSPVLRAKSVLGLLVGSSAFAQSSTGSRPSTGNDVDNNNLDGSLGKQQRPITTIERANSDNPTTTTTSALTTPIASKKQSFFARSLATSTTKSNSASSFEKPLGSSDLNQQQQQQQQNTTPASQSIHSNKRRSGQQQQHQLSDQTHNSLTEVSESGAAGGEKQQQESVITRRLNAQNSADPSVHSGGPVAVGSPKRSPIKKSPAQVQSRFLSSPKQFYAEADQRAHSDAGLQTTTSNLQLLNQQQQQQLDNKSIIQQQQHQQQHRSSASFYQADDKRRILKFKLNAVRWFRRAKTTISQENIGGSGDGGSSPGVGGGSKLTKVWRAGRTSRSSERNSSQEDQQQQLSNDSFTDRKQKHRTLSKDEQQQQPQREDIATTRSLWQAWSLSVTGGKSSSDSRTRHSTSSMGAADSLKKSNNLVDSPNNNNREQPRQQLQDEIGTNTTTNTGKHRFGRMRSGKL